MKDYLRSSIFITKPIIHFDLDGVLCDFDKRSKELEAKGFKSSSLFTHPDAFKNLEPIEGAVEAWNFLQEHFETYILSTPAWSNPDSWSAKRVWVEDFLGKSAKKKLILCHNKGLVIGDYLIDDRTANGVLDFKGEHIHFASTKYPDWNSVLEYFKAKIDQPRFQVGEVIEWELDNNSGILSGRRFHAEIAAIEEATSCYCVNADYGQDKIPYNQARRVWNFRN